MADQRCPMCGKPNAADQEICQYCQARLSPLIAGSSGDESAELSSELPDWLSSLNAGEGSENPELEDSRPDWMEDDHPPSSVSTGSDREPADSTDWLLKLRSEEPEGDLAEQDEVETAENNIDPESENWWNAVDAGEDETLPDWISSMRSEAEHSAPEQGSPAEENHEAGEEPDWLLRIRSRKMDEGLEGVFSDSNGDDNESHHETGSFGDPLSWLNEDTPGDDGSRTESSLFPDGLHSWLSGNGSGMDAEEGPGRDASDDLYPAACTPAAADDEEDAQLPGQDSSQKMERSVSNPGEPVANQPSAGPEEESLFDKMPDWLSEITGSGEGVYPLPAAEPEPDSVPADLPDEFLSSLAAEEDQQSGANSPAFTENEGDASDAAQKISPFTLDQDDGKGFDPLFDDGPPDWLSSITPPAEHALNIEEADTTGSEIAQKTPAFVDGGDAGLVEADLPEWLASMRPSSSYRENPKVVEGADGMVESAGPLGGLRGILPAEPDVSQARKPSAYSLKLQVTDSQQESAELFEQLVKNEAEPRPISTRRAISSQHILRVLIFVALILSVALSLILDIPPAGTAMVDNNSDVQAAVRVVSASGGAGPVLLAFDYEPGFSPEMDLLAESVLNHLMSQNAYLTFVSTSPTGPVLAERMLLQLNQQPGFAYQPENQYINLGYIAGGQVGLQAFSRRPQQVFPFIFDGAPKDASAPLTDARSPWDLQPLQAVDSLDDFALLIVLTENPDTARAWIEQVEPALEDTPLMLMTSGQAEPMVRPYYDSSPKQVDALVSGLSGAAAYERHNQRAGKALSSLNAYAFGIAATIVLVLAGSAINAGIEFLARRKEAAEMGNTR